MNATSVPLSWQQTCSLERDPRLASRNLVALVPLDPDVPYADLKALVRAAEKDVEALRLRITSSEAGSLLPPDAAPAITISDHRQYISEDEVRIDVTKMSSGLTFERSEGALCSVVLYDVVNDAGRPAKRWLAWFFDHLISDVASLELFKDACAQEPRAFGELGGYEEWLRWQAENFRALDTPEADFWREHLRGAQLSICDHLPARIAGQDQLSSSITVAARAIESHGGALWTLCGEHNVTPFMVIAGAVALAVAEATSIQNMAFVLSTHGRDDASAQVFGYLSNLVPLGLTVDASRPLLTLDRVRAAVVDTAAHCSTPWPFINLALGMPRPDALGDATVTLNYLAQFPLTADEFAELNGSTVSGEESGLWIDVMRRPEDGGFYLVVKYDPARYETHRVGELCDLMVSRWDQLLATAQ